MAATYDPEKTYDVRITRPLPLGPTKLLPRDEHRIQGDVLNELVAEHGKEAIDTAEEVGANG